MHTDTTLEILSQVTTSLGNSLREFEGKTCTMFQTRELERERTARQRRQEKNTSSNGEKPKPSAPKKKARKQKLLNLNTYKLHALGDYVSTIRRYGTTDSYTTEPVSCCSHFSLTLLIGIIRVNLSTARRKGVFPGPAADRYHYSCQGSNDEHAASAQSARKCIARPGRQTRRMLSIILKCGIT
jgi:hypothetical protein